MPATGSWSSVDRYVLGGRRTAPSVVVEQTGSHCTPVKIQLWPNRDEGHVDLTEQARALAASLSEMAARVDAITGKDV